LYFAAKHLVATQVELISPRLSGRIDFFKKIVVCKHIGVTISRRAYPQTSASNLLMNGDSFIQYKN